MSPADEQALRDRIGRLVAAAGLAGRPQRLGRALDRLEDLAAEAAAQWTAAFSPRPVDRAALATICRLVLGG